MHRLRWDDLQYVHAVVDQGSLSAAARTLGVNHATVHRRIAALEDSFGITLFDRLPGGYRLRPQARDILGALERIEGEASRIERSFLGTRRSIEGTFRITTTDTIATLLLPAYLASLQDVHPEARIELGVTNLRLDMAQPVAEIAIRPIRVLPDDMSGEQAGVLRFRLYGNEDYLQRNTSSDIADHQLLGVSPTIARSPAGEWQEQALAATPVMTADSFFPLSMMAAKGMGLAMLPTFVGRTQEGLIEAAQFPESPTIPLWVAAHRDLAVLEPINELIAYFAEALGNDPVLAA